MAATALLLLVPATARADARADIFALRHGETPTRHELLGWTASGEAAFRWIACSEGGELRCSAGVGVFGVGTERVTMTLDYEGYDRLPGAMAVRFIRDEREAIEALGPLVPPTGVVLGQGALGEVAGAPTEIRARIVPRDDVGGHVRLAVHGAGGRVELGRVGMASSIDGLDVVVYPSPEGTRLAVAARIDTTMMCWSFTDVAFRVLDVAEVRARLGDVGH